MSRLVIGALVLATSLSLSQTRSDEWRQFRGTADLTGMAVSTPPVILKVLWSYDTSDTIDSSAAIKDGAVYVGVGNDRQTALEIRHTELSRRILAGGRNRCCVYRRS